MKPLIAAVAGVLVLGGAAFGYATYRKTSSPEALLYNAVLNLEQASSATTEGKLTVTGGEAPITVGFNARANQEGDAALTAELTLGTARLDFDLRLLKYHGYLKFDGVKEILDTYTDALESTGGEPDQTTATVMLIATMVSQGDGQWIDLGDAKQAFESQGAGQEIMTKLTEIYKQHSFVTIAEKYPDEDVAGQKSAHYRLDLDRAKLITFLEQTKAQGVAGDNAQDIQDLIDELKAKQGAIELPNTQVWIDRSAKRFTKLLLTVNEDGQTVTFESTFSNYGAPVVVDAPSNALKLEEILQGSQGGNLLNSL